MSPIQVSRNLTVAESKKLISGGSVMPERWLSCAQRYKAGRLSLQGNFLPGRMASVDYEADFTPASRIYGGHKPIAQITSRAELRATFDPKDLPPTAFVMLGGGFGGRLYGYVIPEEQRIKIKAPVIGRVSVTPKQLKDHPELSELLDRGVLQTTKDNDVLAEWTSLGYPGKDTFVQGLWQVEKWRREAALFGSPSGQRTFITPLELRLRYLDALQLHGYKVYPSILANDINSDRILTSLFNMADQDSISLKNVGVFAQVGLPRFIPHPYDLAAEPKFIKHVKDSIGPNADVTKESEAAVKAMGTPGDLLTLEGDVISRKPPGHMDGLTLYMIEQMKQDLARGVEVALLNCGEEIGYLYNPDLIKFVQGSAEPLSFIFYKGGAGGGGAVRRYRDDSSPETPMLQVVEGPQMSPDNKKAVTAYTKNLFEVGINLNRLLDFFGLSGRAFQAMSQDDIRQMLDERLYSKIEPGIEIKPVDAKNGIWAAQVVWMFGQLSSVIPSRFILGDESTFPFPEMKDPDSLPVVNRFAMEFYGQFNQA